MTETQPTPPHKYLTLQPLPLYALPAHPSFPAPTTTTTTTTPPAPELRAFILAILAEALAFTTTRLPTFPSRGTPKSSAPSTAKVHMSVSEVAGAGGDTWFARRSEHADAAVAGTACFAEFVEGLLERHSVNEREYTPDVFDAREVVAWREGVEEVGRGEGWAGWEGVEMEIYEMAHSMPTPLQNRVFPTLVVHARDTPRSFLTVQIPVYVSAHPESFYSSGRHRVEGSTPQEREKVTMGKYVSVERVVARGGGEGEGEGKGTVCWEMATASDAGGYLPMGLQKLGVPGAVLKDVGLFIGWVAGRRGKGQGPGES